MDENIIFISQTDKTGNFIFGLSVNEIKYVIKAIPDPLHGVKLCKCEDGKFSFKYWISFSQMIDKKIREAVVEDPDMRTEDVFSYLFSEPQDPNIIKEHFQEITDPLLIQRIKDFAHEATKYFITDNLNKLFAHRLHSFLPILREN